MLVEPVPEPILIVKPRADVKPLTVLSNVTALFVVARVISPFKIAALL